MISNVPTAEELREVAIRTYFIAWKEASKLLEGVNLLGYFNLSLKNGKLVAGTSEEFDHLTQQESEDNFAKYEAALQPEVHATMSLIQHSQELALKTFICEKSPYLLLLGSDIRQWAKGNTDFTDLKTIDASDLLRVVSAICNRQLSEHFKQNIERIRRGRNSYQHLGKQREKIDVIEPLKILTQQYIEMFPERNWLEDFNSSQQSGLDDLFDSDFTSRTSVLANISEVSEFVPDKMWRRLLGFQKNSRLLECSDCIREAHFDNRNFPANTIEVLPSKNEAHCFLCRQTFKIMKSKCKDCGFDLAYDLNDGSKLCLRCTG
jgi:hypothetical protein